MSHLKTVHKLCIITLNVQYFLYPLSSFCSVTFVKHYKYSQFSKSVEVIYIII